MASTYYVKKNGKFPRALFAEHTGKANFVFHMPNGVMTAKESHSCLRSIQAGNWKVITKEEALALKEKKVSYPRYITGMWTCGSKFIKIIDSTKAILVDKDEKESDYSVAAALDGLKNNEWWEISEAEALAMLASKEKKVIQQYPKYYSHKDCITFGGGGVFIRRISTNELEFVRPDGTTYDKRHWGACETEWAKSGVWREISKEEADKLLTPKEPETPTFKPSGAGVYLTAGGYLVKLDENLCAAGKYSPGLTIRNNCCERSNKYGWIWRVDGCIVGLTPEWAEKLRLVEKMPEGFIIPPETERFKYLDGYPIVRRPDKGEYNIPLYQIKMGQCDTDKLCTMALCLGGDHNTRALIFTKEPEQMACPITQSGQYELMNGQVVNLNLSERIASCSIEDKVKSDCGTVAVWFWNKDGTIGGIGTDSYCKSLYVKRFIGPIKESVANVVAENQKVTTGEEEMKKETAVAVAKTVGNLALRAVNYWAWEPAKNIGGRVLSSVRYVAFFTGITACILGYNYPEQAKALVKSALPKVHISVERPELLK